MAPGAIIIIKLIEGNPYYWGGLLIYICLMGLFFWFQFKSSGDEGGKK